MQHKQAYQITVTLDVPAHELGQVLIAAIDAALHNVQTNQSVHWFYEGEAVPFKVYQQCEFNALMALYEDDVVLDLMYDGEE